MVPSLTSIILIFGIFLIFESAYGYQGYEDFVKSFSSVKSRDDVTLVWNVTASTQSRNKKILSNVKGSARIGKFHAIIGPSGSGKTTLLNILANNVPKKSLTLEGQVLSLPSVEPIFVEQESLLFPQLTVLETLHTSVALKVDIDQASKDDLVEKAILDLGLKKVRESKVGDIKTRGISGGEKKRLCIGNECIGSSIGIEGTHNSVIFADEPTSGLDTYQAQRVIELLKDLATTSGCTIVSSLHQPRLSIFAMFDDITLLSEGLCMYTGPALEMATHFRSCGYNCPYNINPAEYCVDLVSVDYSSPDEEIKSKQRIQKLAQIFETKISKDLNLKQFKSPEFQSISIAKKLTLKGENKGICICVYMYICICIYIYIYWLFIYFH
jgi:ABC-type multidrug transport system ATPase subunit